jgi:hypothetical protein
MPATPRPNKEAAKIAYKILKTPKDRQQHNQPDPSEKRIKEWFREHRCHNNIGGHYAPFF